MAIDKLNFNSVDIGKVDLPSGKFADTLMQYGQQLNETERQRRLDAQNALSMQMNQARFAREQELNKRNDTEYNREIGLRDTRQNLSKEFLANPYAAKFGSGKETALLDKQVNDYVNSGGEINEDMAKRLQAKYEEARPFREDATNALTSQMVLAGEDPTKAAQTGAALGSNLLSRVEQQAAVSANRKIEQDQYDEAAKRNKDALQLKLDIAKANQTGDKDKAELLFKQYQSVGGGGTGGGSSTASGLMETLGKIGPVDASSALAEGGPIDLARKAGYTESQIARAAGQSLDTDPTAWTWADNKLDTTMFTRNLGMQQPGSGLSKSINIRDIQAPTAEEWNSIVPNRAGYRVVDYDPKRFLEGSKGVLPELFGKDAEKPLLSDTSKTVSSNPNVPLDRGGKSVLHVKGVPDSLIVNEGLQTGSDGMFRSYTDSNAKGENKGLAVAGGYNYTTKSPSEIRSDFKAAGIPETQIQAAIEGKPIKLSEEDGKNLFAVSYKRIGDEKASKLLPEYKNMNPLVKEIAADMAYRGDLVAGENSYRGDLVKVLKTGDINQVYKYVNETDIPVEVKTRLGNILTMERDTQAGVKPTEKSVLGTSEATPVKELFANAETNKLPAIEVRAQMDELNKKGINTKEDEAAFNNLQKQYKVAKTREVEDNPIYKMTAPELIGNLLGISTANKPIVEDSQAIRQQRIADKYLSNPAGLTANEKQWIEGNKTTPNGRKLLESLGIK